jgi:hypothetical protein
MSAFGKREGGGRRSCDREDLSLMAVFTTRTRSHSAMLVDLSATGARVRGNDLPEADEDLILSIEGVSTYGIVKWKRLGFCGIEFDAPLPLAAIKMLEHKVRMARGLPPQIMAAMEDWAVGLAR